jgi:uncharacterized protein (TIGR02246 family)
VKKLAMLFVLALALLSPLWVLKADRPQANDETEIRNLIDRWTKAFEAKDLNGVMSIYAQSGEVLAYDIVPPLEYVGFDAYKQDYHDFFDGFEGPLQVEVRDLHITTGGSVAFSNGLERIVGTMKNGQKFDAWIRFTECYRKINGRWQAVHDHISVPVDFDTGKALLDLKP